MKKQKNSGINDIDFLLRESVNSIKGSIDQIFFGILDFLQEEEKTVFLKRLKTQSDSLQEVLYKSIMEHTQEISDLNTRLTENNFALSMLRNSLELKVLERTKEIKQVQDVTIFSLARLAESRDQETGDHLDRIRSFCYLLADHLYQNKKFPEEITPAFIYDIYHTSPLHDIGKVGIEDKILLKPGKLTEREFEVMKQHTVIGGKTLFDAEKQLTKGDSSFLSMGRKIAYFHHEKWNGSGYPYGLKREDIPLCARIVAVADVYDALTTKRIYKEAFPHSDAKQIIVDNKETHFDPVLVETFLALEEKFQDLTQNGVFSSPAFGGQF